jgi:hypothetical protein
MVGCWYVAVFSLLLLGFFISPIWGLLLVERLYGVQLHWVL